MQRSMAQRRAFVSRDEDSPLSAASAQQALNAPEMVADAIAQGRLRLAFQPVMTAAEPARIAFHEAFIRVLDPTGRIIPARDFMSAIEMTDAGRQIDCAALDMGIALLAATPGLRLAINMSARSIGYPRWMRLLRRGLAARPDAGARLILEINEGSALLLPEIVMAFMEEMQGSNVTFALDDFGAGHSSFRHLRDFAFDIAKIDGRFVRGVQDDPDTRAVTAGMVALARNLQMLTVAEAVETPEEAAAMRALGVDCLQGYLFGAPTLDPPRRGG